MSDIDPEKLAKAIDDLRDELGRLRMPENIANATILIAAAERTLATLPRFKEVEVERWAVLSPDANDCFEFFRTEEGAQNQAKHSGVGCIVVRLTGTAKVKVTP